MGAAEGSTKHIVQSLFVNLAIAAAKGVAAALTGSGAMLAETSTPPRTAAISCSCCSGTASPEDRRRAASARLRARSLLLVLRGRPLALLRRRGVLHLRGLHKIRHPEPVEHVLVG